MHLFKVRLFFISFLLALCLSFIIGRLVIIQVVNGKSYAKESRRQSQHRQVVIAKRGAIRDCNGVILSATLPDYIPIKKDVSSTASDKNRLSRDGEYAHIKRICPYGELAGQVIGFVGKDGFGLGGIEYMYDRCLRGENGWSIMQKDGRNNRYQRIDMPMKKPVDGSDVYLCIDLYIQQIVENVLKRAVQKFKAKGGMCIVMNPWNGDVLAMANIPGFNPNISGQYSPNERTNHCVSYNLEPGSTFKVITTTAALENGLIGLKDSIDGDNGSYTIYDQTIKDHKPFAMLTFEEALWYSSNVCFAKVARKIGNERLYRYTKDFGLGNKTGIDYPGDEAGIVHPVDKWSGRTLVTMAMGQEVSVTPIQMMCVFSAIANGGVLLVPSLIQKVCTSDGRVTTLNECKRVRRVMSEKSAEILRNMLRGVVEFGTGKKAAITGVSVGGKTGTSQKIDKESGTYSNNKVIASFIGFVPVEKPVLACGIMIDEPEYGEGGGVAAAPSFSQIIGQIISHPKLNYAELILDRKDDKENRQIVEKGELFPNLCGMDTRKAARLLSKEDFKFELIGMGEKVSHQAPSAGTKVSIDKKMILYTKIPDVRDSVTGLITIPNCIGKDLRDALNAVFIKGLVPYVNGAGIVRKQIPTVGTVIEGGEVCTLFCSFDG